MFQIECTGNLAINKQVLDVIGAVYNQSFFFVLIKNHGYRMHHNQQIEKPDWLT
jgi:hypothetical protein